MPTLTVDAKALTGESVDTLANEPWTLVGHPLATASGSTVLLGSLVRKGELDDNGMAVIEDVPESPDNSWLTFRMAGIGTVVGFQMPSTDVTLGEAYAAFGEYPGPVGPTPGPPGETGPPGPQGERGLRGLGAPFQVFVYTAQASLLSTPTLPTGGLYNIVFDPDNPAAIVAGSWTTLPDGWFAVPPPLVDGQTLWFASATILPIPPTGDQPERYSPNPVWQVVGEAGEVGPPGRDGARGPAGADGTRGTLIYAGVSDNDGDPTIAAADMQTFDGADQEVLAADWNDADLAWIQPVNTSRNINIYIYNGTTTNWLLYYALDAPEGDRGPQGPPGADGRDGTDGLDGSNGNRWAEGIGNPTSTTIPNPIAGDMYLDDSGRVWRYSGTSWGRTTISLRGPAGPDGVRGPRGASGAKGDKGDQGDRGPEGPKGDKGDPGTGAAVTRDDVLAAIPAERESWDTAAARSRDLRVAPNPGTWADLSSDTAGGLAVSAAQPGSSTVAGLGYSTHQVSTLPGGTQRYLVYRIPTAQLDALAHYRVVYSINRQGSTVLGLGDFVHTGDIGGWSYFTYPRQLTFEAGISLQSQTDTAQAQIGGSTFIGNLEQSKVYDQVKKIINPAGIITAVPDDSTEQVTIGGTAGSGSSIEAFTMSPGTNREQAATTPTTQNLTWTAATSPVSLADNTHIAFPAGVYELVFDVQVYTTPNGNIPLISNDRYNLFVVTTAAPSDAIFDQLTNPYYRPINRPFGPPRLAFRLVVPTAGNIRFALSIQGDTGDNGYLGTTAVRGLRLGDIA